MYNLTIFTLYVLYLNTFEISSLNKELTLTILYKDILYKEFFL